MSFFNDMDADLVKALEAEIGPGENILIYPHAEEGETPPPVMFRAVFDQPGQAVSLGSAAGVASEAPWLHLRERDYYFLLGRHMSRRDRVEIRGKLYRYEQPDPDSTGWISLKLLEA